MPGTSLHAVLGKLSSGSYKRPTSNMFTTYHPAVIILDRSILLPLCARKRSRGVNDDDAVDVDPK